MSYNKGDIVVLLRPLKTHGPLKYFPRGQIMQIGLAPRRLKNAYYFFLCSSMYEERSISEGISSVLQRRLQFTYALPSDIRRATDEEMKRFILEKTAYSL